MAPQPLVPSGISGRNRSYKAKGLGKFPWLECSGQFFHGVAHFGKSLAEFPTQVSLDTLRIDLLVLDDRTNALCRVNGWDRSPTYLDPEFLATLLLAGVLAVFLARLEDAQSSTFGLCIEPRHRLAKRQSFVPLKPQTLGDHGSPQRQHWSTVDRDDVLRHGVGVTLLAQ